LTLDFVFIARTTRWDGELFARKFAISDFPRFLEAWGLANPLTYNGSMVKMFPSLYATNIWGLGNVYNPPKRNWAYDLNFNTPAKLPPLTPSLLKIFRSQWTTLAPNSTTPPPSS
jgi:hypothetical protein